MWTIDIDFFAEKNFVYNFRYFWFSFFSLVVCQALLSFEHTHDLHRFPCLKCEESIVVSRFHFFSSNVLLLFRNIITNTDFDIFSKPINNINFTGCNPYVICNNQFAESVELKWKHIMISIISSLGTYKINYSHFFSPTMCNKSV
jgi:hypothetical protein